MSAHKRDFRTLGDLSRKEYNWLFERAAELKALRRAKRNVVTLAGKTLALVFEKASTRTRVSFEAAIAQLGGHAVALPLESSQLARGEPLEDTARVLSGYVDAIVMRTHSGTRFTTFADAASVPVINGLTDDAHPVQLLADLFTVIETFGGLAGRRVAWIGDGASNMARSWIEAAGLFGFELVIAAPAGYRAPAPGANVAFTDAPAEAARGADVVTTDVWTSMGQEAEGERRRRDFAGYIVDAPLVARAKADAIVLHCLPAHRGEEISEEALLGPRSRVFQEAENRLHAQKALLELLLT